MVKEELLEAILQWDSKAWSRALHYWDNQVEWGTVKTALELGGNSGGLSIWLASNGVDVICSDLEGVEEKASGHHAPFEFRNKITYQDINACDIPYENLFDLVVFKSVLGGVGRDNNFSKQKEAVDQIYNALKPGGKLLFAENLIASPVHRFARKKFVHWGKSWRYLTLNEMKSLLSGFETYSIRATGFASAFGRSNGQRNSLASLDRLFFNYSVPKNWKYIAYGVAIK